MALPHGNLTINQDVIGIVDNVVHNSLGNGAGLFETGVHTLISFAGVILGAEDGGVVGVAGLHKLQQIVGFLKREAADEPLTQD